MQDKNIDHYLRKTWTVGFMLFICISPAEVARNCVIPFVGPDAWFFQPNYSAWKKKSGANTGTSKDDEPEKKLDQPTRNVIQH